MQYEIQIDNGIAGQCYEDFDSLESAIDYAKNWVFSSVCRGCDSVRVQVSLADSDEWAFDEIINANQNCKKVQNG
jgi:hypothetical protein